MPQRSDDMRDELTEIRQQILEFVRGYIGARGFSPRIREANAVGLRSTSSTLRHLDRVESGVQIRRSPRPIALLESV